MKEIESAWKIEKEHEEEAKRSSLQELLLDHLGLEVEEAERWRLKKK